jgi:Rod binding domain-containing protein
MIDGPKGIEALLPELSMATTEAKKKEIATEEFLSLFLRELVKTMNDTAKGLFGKGFASEVYRSLFEMELARALAKEPILKKALLRQLNMTDLLSDGPDVPNRVKDFSRLSDKSSEGCMPSGIENRQQKEADNED